jgi:hypothetical protein
MALKFDDMCAKTVEEVRSDKCELNWVAFKYEGKAKIIIGAKGEGGCEPHSPPWQRLLSFAPQTLTSALLSFCACHPLRTFCTHNRFCTPAPFLIILSLQTIFLHMQIIGAASQSSRLIWILRRTSAHGLSCA